MAEPHGRASWATPLLGSARGVAAWVRTRPLRGKRGEVALGLLRRLGALVLALLVLGGLCALQYDAWRVRRPGAFIAGVVNPDLPKNGDGLAPNLHHVWGSKGVPGLRTKSGKLNGFGRDLDLYASRGWKFICELDSDQDGVKNGDELGDPCCQWVSGEAPPYRVWNLSQPGFAEPPEKGFLLTQDKLEDLSPSSCSTKVGHELEEAEALRRMQFEKQYYMKFEMDTHSPENPVMVSIKFVGCFGIVLLLGHWSLNRGLLRDLLGAGPAAKVEGAGGPEAESLGWKARLGIYVAAYFWTDGVAGLTHLTFDFCPQWYPIIGSVARGFQFHHFHPTAWVVVPIAKMLSHSVPLIGLLSLAVTVIPPRRCFRAFWALTYVLCVLTVLTHRWVHVPPEENYQWFQWLQNCGLVMTHEHHMIHHNSLVTQFSNLSGVTDFILDYVATHWLPPTAYQHWLAVCLLYFAVPIALGAEPLAHAGKKVQPIKLP